MANSQGKSKKLNRSTPAQSGRPKREKPKLVTIHSARMHSQPAEGGRDEIDEALRHEDEQRMRRKAA